MKYEEMKYELEVLSPVHIGTGDAFSPADFIISADRFIVFNIEKFFKSNPERVDEFVKEIEAKGSKFSLNDFLNDKEIKNEESWIYSENIESSTKDLISRQIEEGRMADVQQFIKTAKGELYIPGSSIKGAIRTALAYQLLKDDDYSRNTLRQSPSGKLVEKLAFRGKEDDAKYDVLKMFEISDSHAFKTTELQVMYSRVLTTATSNSHSFWQLKRDRGTGKMRRVNPRYSIFEGVPQPKEGLIIKGSIGVNEKIAMRIKSNMGWSERSINILSVENIMKACNNFSEEIINFETSFLKQYSRPHILERKEVGADLTKIIEFYYSLRKKVNEFSKKEKECLLRLGWGSGWHGTTVGHLLQNDQEFNFKKFRGRYGLGKPGIREFPKTRRLVFEDGKPTYPLGWVKLKLGE